MGLLIKRILDQILNPSPPSTNPNQPPVPSQDTVQTDGHSTFDTVSLSGFAFDGNQFDPIPNWEDGLGDLDWLNAVDWSRGPWRLDLGGQDFSAARWN
jgi:hypothetical protein